MSDNTTIFAFPPSKPEAKIDQAPVAVEGSSIKKPAMVLDMGEASREQGFRLNGCR